ncbi:acetyl-CoA carboxylase biotin carboxylase subunit [Chondromyces apiculatus]|uniref:Biotin carboxylase of acetyl-CoA carboxylase n=1 Tax=Chondromyces apiculatus DSM 436 TaxID=1192034 RepID=A0A017T8U8_9BACT|nr:acetyl-CoA carboxylase biotin carboxylase subunit [Chondromyces apiculatus]EYF05240.1 Biotin carboxylase of acetyl-CoA carboxylase [Chondromyces apiculatus DSM 436]
MIRKVLIANRGEIAVRILRTLHEMGIQVVAVYSEADRGSLHVRLADEAYAIGPALASESYLRIDKILDVARRSGADAIHPGYGFLSENRDFAAACEAAGVTFIGPPASAMEAMGSKTAARARMMAAGVPITPGGDANSPEEALATAERLGYPVMLKAAFGGGGKGMRLVERAEDLASAFERAQSEAQRAFGNATVYLEKAIVRPRHVEIQVLGDRHGNMVHLFERDCSIQRRHQKVVEEAPCPVADDDLVRRMGEVAVRGALSVGYFSAGTFEFLLGEDGSFYFLEMNTRLQVEHPITEWVTGVDLVAEMVRVAAGEKLSVQQETLTRRGASIECRIYAEDPGSGFLPSPGKLTALRAPSGPWVRDDGGFYEGSEVPSHYDPLVSKLSVWGVDRRAALSRMQRALSEYVVTGIKTNLSFHQHLMAHPEFQAGRYHTGFIGEHTEALCGPTQVPTEDEERLAVAMAVATARAEQRAATAIAPPSGGKGVSPWVYAHRAFR